MNEIVHPFTETPKCIKCDSAAITTYWCTTSEAHDWAHKNVLPHLTEALHRICRNCKYEWLTKIANKD